MPKSEPVALYHVWKRFTSNSCRVSACDLMKLTNKCLANNYCPLPVVISRGRGVRLYDVDGKEYLDFNSGCGSVSLGHCHPKVAKVLCDEAKLLTNSSREFYSRALAEFGEYMTELFCYDKVLPMNTGAEAGDTAVKLARKWGYKMKGIPPNQAKIICLENSNWGSTIASISSSNEFRLYCNYGPFVPGFDNVPFNDVDCLEYKMKDPNVCALMIEPIQGQAGVIIPEPCYLKQVRELCTRNKVLMIADEVYCGLGRTGSLLSCDIYRVRPDMVILGKALTGGFLPVSAVLADADIMDVMEPGTHGSTFGGNHIGCKVAIAALKTLQEEKLIDNSRCMGEILRGCLCDLPKDVVSEVRGIGLLNAIVLKEGINATDVCIDLINNGLLVKDSINQVIRLLPPLVIKERDIQKASQIIRHCIENSRGNCGGGCSTSSKPTSSKAREKLSKCAEIVKNKKGKTNENLKDTFKKLCMEAVNALFNILHRRVQKTFH